MQAYCLRACVLKKKHGTHKEYLYNFIFVNAAPSIGKICDHFVVFWVNIELSVWNICGRNFVLLWSMCNTLHIPWELEKLDFDNSHIFFRKKKIWKHREIIRWCELPFTGINFVFYHIILFSLKIHKPFKIFSILQKVSCYPFSF